MILLASRATSLHELLETSEDICYLEESQITNALANVVVAKVKIIGNYVITFTLLITLVFELAATNKRPVSQLTETLGQ